MKKIIILLSMLFCAQFTLAQSLIIEVEPTLTNEQSFGVYVPNKEKIKLDKIFITIADNEYSTEPFEVAVLSAPKMKSHEMYDNKKFKQLNLTPIIAKGKKGGGVIEIDVSDNVIKIDKDFIIELRPTQESIKNTRKKEVKYSDSEGDVKTKIVSYYGPSFIKFDDVIPNQFFIVKYLDSDNYSCMSKEKISAGSLKIRFETIK